MFVLNFILLIAIFFFIAFLLCYIGFILGLIEAFREDVAWGVVYWWVPLFGALIFYLKKWSNKKIRKSFFLMVTGWLMVLLGGALLQQAHSGFQTSTTFGSDINSAQNTSESSSPSTIEFNISPPPIQESSPGNQPSPRLDAASVPGNKDEFKKSMKLGYFCYAQRDYQTALINFNRALQVSPGDAYAVKAVDNTKMAIAGRQTK
jgi:uncharacterized membrane protein